MKAHLILLFLVIHVSADAVPLRRGFGNQARPLHQPVQVPPVKASAKDRPAIETVKPEVLRDDFWEEYDEGKHKLLRAKLFFLAEIMAFYRDHELYFLARDCDSLYDLARTIYADQPEVLERMHLVNVSRDIAKDPNLRSYLEQERVFDDTSMPALLIDQGFEGSIPNAIWQKHRGKRVIRSFFISSVHPDIPSSRVASRPYAPLYDGDHDEASGDLVDDLEGLSHYLPKSATSLEMRRAEWVPVLEMPAAELAKNEETLAALAYMKRVRAFGLSSRSRAEFHSLRESMARLWAYLASDDDLEPARTKALAVGAKMAAGPEVLQDLRELYWKGHLPVSAARFQEFWLQYSGAAPEIPDMHDDVVEDARRGFPDATAWLTKDWEAASQGALEAGSEAVKIAFSLRLPSLWESVLDACIGGTPEQVQGCIEALTDSPYLEEMPRSKWAVLFDKSPNSPTVTALLERLGKVPSYATAAVAQPAGLTHEEVAAYIRAANQKTRQLGDRWRMGSRRELGEKLGEGTHCDVYALGPASVIKLPAEAEDVAYLEVERRIYDDIRLRAPEIGLVAITEAHPEGFFLVKDRVPAALHATEVLKAGLRDEQLTDLERLFQASRRYARATGLGLDLKADNLAWIDGEWKLMEAGPRIRHVPYGFTLEPASFAAYLDIWHLDDLPGPARIKPEDVKREALAPVTVTARPVAAAVPSVPVARTAKRTQPWWATAPSHQSSIKKVESLVEIEELPKAALIHHLDYFEIARQEGRIFENPAKGSLPAGVFTFVVFDDGTWVFGLDAKGLELGVKHFQLAQGRAVVAAGEFNGPKFSLMSGGFSKQLLKTGKYSEEETSGHVQRLFRDRLELEVTFSQETLIEKPDTVSVALLRPYCANPTFHKLHGTICADWNAGETCADAVLRRNP